MDVLLCILLASLVVSITVIGVFIVSKLDDLATAVTNLNDSVTAEIAEIVVALNAANGGNDPLIQAQIDRLVALKQRVDDETTAITPPPAP